MQQLACLALLLPDAAANLPAIKFLRKLHHYTRVEKEQIRVVFVPPLHLQVDPLSASDKL
jgi:hypothetical protein